MTKMLPKLRYKNNQMKPGFNKLRPPLPGIVYQKLQTIRPQQVVLCRRMRTNEDAHGVLRLLPRDHLHSWDQFLNPNTSSL